MPLLEPISSARVSWLITANRMLEARAALLRQVPLEIFNGHAPVWIRTQRPDLPVINPFAMPVVGIMVRLLTLNCGIRNHKMVGNRVITSIFG